MQTFEDILNSMLAEAHERDAKPCSLLFHGTMPRGDTPFNAIWLFEAPYAHSLWHQYVVLLVDLTTSYQRDPILYKEDATHEVLCFALSPDYPVIKNADNSKPEGWKYLTPANFAYQIKADDDAAALKFVDDLVKMFIAKQMNPDTDFNKIHDAYFARMGGVPLSKENRL